jgi:hypothetical protein
VANAESNEELGGRARWQATIDAVGSTLTEPPAAPFAPGGAHGTERTARVSGTLGASTHAFAALRLELEPGGGAAFGSQPVGFAFWAKSKVASFGTKFQLSVTCWSHDSFEMDIPLFDSWTQYSVPFTALKPALESDSSALDWTRIQRIEWRPTGSGVPYDLAVDEVIALGCRPHAVPPSCYAK